MRLFKPALFLIFASQAMFTSFALSKTSATGMCTTSAQQDAFIVIDVEQDGRNTAATITTSGLETTETAKIKIEGKQPDVGVIFAKTSEGEDIFIFSYFDDREVYRQYVCAKAQ